MIEAIDSHIPRYRIMTALCHSTHDGWTDKDIPQLEVGKTYNVDYAVIGRSWTKICLSEYPEHLFSSVLFSFFFGGEIISPARDYRELKRITNDTYRATTLIIYSDLSEDRIEQIRKRHSCVRIIIRSDILNRTII